VSQNSSKLSEREWLEFFRDVLFPWWTAEERQGREAIRNLIKVDRYYLLVQVLNRKDALHPWVYERCREVEADPDDHIDIWAREHFKSTIITFAGIIQETLKDPEITVGIFSHIAPLAKDFLGQIKIEYESNELLRSLFPDIIWADPWKDSPSWSLDRGLTLIRKSNPKEKTIEAHGLVDGQPTGKHYKLRVYDDVVTDKSVYTPEQITKTNDAFSLSDNLGSIGGRRWICGTRYHYADTYADIISRGSAKVRIYPATDTGEPDGTPVLLPEIIWEKKKVDQTPADIACQQLCNPLAGKQRMFSLDDLGEWDVRPSTLNAYLIVDPARSMKKDSTNTSMVVVGVSAQNNKYFLDGVCHKMTLGDRWKWLRDLHHKWADQPGIVSLKVGYEAYGAQADMDYFMERMRTEKDEHGKPHHFDIEELRWPRDGEASKRDRIQRLVPDVQAHRFLGPFYTPDDALTSNQKRMMQNGMEHVVSGPIKRIDENDEVYEVWERFKQELEFFPYGAKKDLIDATSRIYDMEPTPPGVVDDTYLEPEFN
jgi:hypothetical protein